MPIYAPQTMQKQHRKYFTPVSLYIDTYKHWKNSWCRILCLITKIIRYQGLSCAAWSSGKFLYGVKRRTVTKTNDRWKIIEWNFHIGGPKPIFLADFFAYKRLLHTYSLHISGYNNKNYTEKESIFCKSLHKNSFFV